MKAPATVNITLEGATSHTISITVAYSSNEIKKLSISESFQYLTANIIRKRKIPKGKDFAKLRLKN